MYCKATCDNLELIKLRFRTYQHLVMYPCVVVKIEPMVRPHMFSEKAIDIPHGFQRLRKFHINISVVCVTSASMNVRANFDVVFAV